MHQKELKKFGEAKKLQEANRAGITCDKIQMSVDTMYAVLKAIQKTKCPGSVLCSLGYQL